MILMKDRCIPLRLRFHLSSFCFKSFSFSLFLVRYKFPRDVFYDSLDFNSAIYFIFYILSLPLFVLFFHFIFLKYVYAA